MSAVAKPLKPFISVHAQPMQELAGKETVVRDFFGTPAEYHIWSHLHIWSTQLKQFSEAMQVLNFEGFLSSLRSCGWRGWTCAMVLLTNFGSKMLKLKRWKHWKPQARCSIRSVQQRYPEVPLWRVMRCWGTSCDTRGLWMFWDICRQVICVVYTGDTDVKPSELLFQVGRRGSYNSRSVRQDVCSSCTESIRLRRGSGLGWTSTAKAPFLRKVLESLWHWHMSRCQCAICHGLCQVSALCSWPVDDGWTPLPGSGLGGIEVQAELPYSLLGRPRFTLISQSLGLIDGSTVTQKGTVEATVTTKIYKVYIQNSFWDSFASMPCHLFQGLGSVVLGRTT